MPDGSNLREEVLIWGSQSHGREAMTVGAAVSMVVVGEHVMRLVHIMVDRTQVGLEPRLRNNPQSSLPSDPPPPAVLPTPVVP